MQEATKSGVLLEGILSWVSRDNIELLPGAAMVPDKQPGSTHMVRYGGILSSVAYQYGTDYQMLATLNGLTSPDLIYPDQVLKANGSATSNVYAAKYGDNLSSIATRLDTNYQVLVTLNGLADPNLVYPDQTLNC